MSQAASAEQSKTIADRLQAGFGRRVVCYGTSLTACGAWVTQVETQLAHRVKFVNSGMGRQHSRWGVQHLEDRVLAHRPDLVLIEFAVNDAVARFCLSLEESRANLLAMVDRIAERLPACLVCLQVMNPVVGRPAGHAGYRPCLPQYEQVYRDVACERGLMLIDHAPAWRELLAQGEEAFLRYVPDGLHPSAEGEARYVTPAIVRALSGKSD